MSVNTVNNAQAPAKKGGIKETLIQQGTSALTGGLTGAAVGAAVGTLKPVSKKQIAAEIVDYYVKNDKGVINECIEAQNRGEITEDLLKKAGDAIDAFGEKATKIIKDCFDKPRKERISETDELVLLAKKCAKKAQKSKFIGTAVFAGVMVGLLGVLFNVGPKINKKSATQEAPANNISSKMPTHQG